MSHYPRIGDHHPHLKQILTTRRLSNLPEVKQGVSGGALIPVLICAASSPACNTGTHCWYPHPRIWLSPVS